MRRSNLAQKQDLLKPQGTAAPRPFLVPQAAGQPHLTARKHIVRPFVPAVPLSVELRDQTRWWMHRRRQQWRQMLLGLGITAAACAAWYFLVARLAF